MAFTKNKLCPVSNNARAGSIPMIWLYDNIDGDTMTTAGLIASGLGVSARDTVKAYDTDGDTVDYKVAITANVISLVAIAYI